RDPEPSAADRQLPRDGGAVEHVRRSDPRRAGEGAADRAADGSAIHGAGAVPRLSRRAGCREGFVHGDVCGAAAARRFVALGRRAVLRPRGKVAGEDGRMEAYERLLGDAIAGDATLFARQDVVEAAWAIVDPVIHGPSPMYDYDPGTWGPKEAEALVANVGGWNTPA